MATTKEAEASRITETLLKVTLVNLFIDLERQIPSAQAPEAKIYEAYHPIIL